MPKTFPPENHDPPKTESQNARKPPSQWHFLANPIASTLRLIRCYQRLSRSSWTTNGQRKSAGDGSLYPMKHVLLLEDDAGVSAVLVGVLVTCP
jgi:hypothetical protein